MKNQLKKFCKKVFFRKLCKNMQLLYLKKNLFSTEKLLRMILIFLIILRKWYVMYIVLKTQTMRLSSGIDSLKISAYEYFWTL